MSLSLGRPSFSRSGPCRAGDVALCFIVDDHDDTREGFAEYLRESGFEVETASDAGELHTLLAAVTPAAIVMDVQMPRVDGWTLTREIKGDLRTRNVPILLCSASSREEDRVAAVEAGADAFISKPCDPHIIVMELTRLLKEEAPDRVRISTS
jgi:two-component system, cell cycle response regulator DivK